MTDFSGMTVNERLGTLGLSEAFDDAARRGDRDALIAVLARVDVPEATADAVLNDPEKYGY